MTISPEAVQAALGAYKQASITQVLFPYKDHEWFEAYPRSLQAALAAAFPIMLREVATDISKNGCPNGFHPYLVQLADSFSGRDG